MTETTLWRIGETVVCVKARDGAALSPGDTAVIQDIAVNPHSEQMLLLVDFHGILYWIPPYTVEPADPILTEVLSGV